MLLNIIIVGFVSFIVGYCIGFRRGQWNERIDILNGALDHAIKKQNASNSRKAS